jgi:hypothetical protein
MSENTYKSLKYQIGRHSHKIEKDGNKSWLRRPKLYKRVVEPYKKKKKKKKCVIIVCAARYIVCAARYIVCAARYIVCAARYISCFEERCWIQHKSWGMLQHVNFWIVTDISKKHDFSTVFRDCGTCNVYGRGKRCVQSFGGETWGKETTGETQT